MLPLSIGQGREATLLVPASIEPSTLERLRERVLPSLQALLGAALDRDELQSEVVETRALRYSDSLKTALLRSVSHDLRTPLTAIVAASAALDSPSIDPSERQEILAGIGQQARRLSRLVDQLLDLSRLEAGTAEPRRDWCSIEELVRDALDQLGDGDAGLFALSVRPGVPLVKVDAAQLERALVNLLENAKRYSRGHEIKVRAGAIGERVVIRIVDRGPGIPHSQLSHIFEPFYRLADDGEHPGSGLGLAIARGFVEANDGRLTAESLPGQGTTFVIELPVNGAVSTSSGRVLVCDDELQIVRALKVILRDAGFEVVATATATEALDAAAVRAPDAAIIDLVLPDGDGVEVCSQLRSWSEMPILVLSAVGEEAEKVRALEAGADDYVTKPFGPRELVARLKAVMRRAGAGDEEPTIEVEGLSIDLAARTVRVGGEEVHLTPLEYDLLRTLARNRGRLMTHRALLQEVWGPGYADDTPVLRTHIANLRRKVEPEGTRRYILTDPGIGYRFAA